MFDVVQPVPQAAPTTVDTSAGLVQTAVSAVPAMYGRIKPLMMNTEENWTKVAREVTQPTLSTGNNLKAATTALAAGQLASER